VGIQKGKKIRNQISAQGLSNFLQRLKGEPLQCSNGESDSGLEGFQVAILCLHFLCELNVDRIKGDPFEAETEFILESNRAEYFTCRLCPIERVVLLPVNLNELK